MTMTDVLIWTPAALLVLCGTLAAEDGTVAHVRPQGLAPGRVMTPFGSWDPAHVHITLPGQRVRREVDGSSDIIDARGAIVEHHAIQRGAGGIAAPGSTSFPGWVAAAYWSDQVSQPVTAFTAQWEVPLPPLRQENQLIYLFDGMLDGTGGGEGIIQPVLQWGNSNFDSDPAWGGNYWTIASWYVVNSTEIYHTVPVPVAPGQVLTGLMVQSGSGKSYTCACGFAGVGQTLIDVANPSPFIMPLMTLEAYNLSDPADYPQTKATVFANTQLTTTAGAPAAPWTAAVPGVPWTLNNAYGEHATVLIDAANGGAVALYYGAASQNTPFDFDGDGRADCGIYRPTDGGWFVALSDGGVFGTFYGAPEDDLPIPADYEGGGICDVAVYRTSTAQWFTPPTPAGNQYGLVGQDLPVPGDYLGQGYAQEAVYRTTTGQWFTPTAPTGVAYGWVGHDVPVPADYLGTGQTDIAVYRPDTGQWFTPASPQGVAYGWAFHDVPVPADYDGVHHDQIAVYRPDTGQWFIAGHTTPIDFGFPFVDIPVPADYDGVGHAEIAVYRPTTGEFLILGHASAITAPSGGPVTGDVPLSLPVWYRFHPF